MATEVELNDDVLAELLELTKDKKPAQAIQTAVKEYIRYRHRLELIAMSGKVVWQEDWVANETPKPRKLDGR